MGKQVIITGFHRSGTSVTAMLLHRAGLFLGKELLDANPSNPYGHFEDVEIMRLHETILGTNGLTWQVGDTLIPIITNTQWSCMRDIISRRQAKYDVWGFKDPRVCLFLMPWKYLLPEAKALIIYRHPSACCYSLTRRHSRDLFTKKGPVSLHMKFWEEPDLALRMWLVHNKNLLAFARIHPKDCIVLSYRMIIDGYPLVAVLNHLWKLGLEQADITEVFDSSVATKQIYKQAVSEQTLVDKTLRIWEDLEERSAESLSLAEEIINEGR